MWQVVVNTAGRLLHDFHRTWLREPIPVDAQPQRPLVSSTPGKYHALQRLTLTDGVARTLFEEYAVHRHGEHGEDETGWILLGVRDAEEAVALATLPAGANSRAGVAHVQFNSSAQALGSCIIRQQDRRLTTLGVVHTHPGTLRHPSDGDFRGDRLWVGQLRGGEGVFGIGTVEAAPSRKDSDVDVARQPRPNVQCLGELRFSWYALRQGDRNYRPLPYRLTLGPDLARPLHPAWPTLERHAEPLERLFRQQAGVSFTAVPGKKGPALAMRIPLVEPKEAVRVLMEGKEIGYYLERDGDIFAADSDPARVDRGVYLLLAELTAQR